MATNAPCKLPATTRQAPRATESFDRVVVCAPWLAGYTLPWGSGGESCRRCCRHRRPPQTRHSGCVLATPQGALQLHHWPVSTLYAAQILERA